MSPYFSAVRHGVLALVALLAAACSWPAPAPAFGCLYDNAEVGCDGGTGQTQVIADAGHDASTDGTIDGNTDVGAPDATDDSDADDSDASDASDDSASDSGED